MKRLLRQIFTVLALLLLRTPALHAEEPYFVITNAEGNPRYEVTQKVVDGMPSHSYEVILASGDGRRHIARGPLMRDILEASGLEGDIVRVRALDGYVLDIPVSDFTEFDVLAAVEIDGKRIAVRERGPAWIVYPNVDHPELAVPLYDTRSIWQLDQIVFQ